VEVGTPQQLFQTPKHPYTAALLSAVPKPDPRQRGQRVILTGEVASPANPPSGCYFHPRCPFATDRCRKEAPQLEEIGPGRMVSCHRAQELDLAGANGTIPVSPERAAVPGLAPPVKAASQSGAA
jgi:peptide/nickel transport system ATP-binding protein